jgi:hypothetical protein
MGAMGATDDQVVVIYCHYRAGFFQWQLGGGARERGGGVGCAREGFNGVPRVGCLPLWCSGTTTAASGE